MIDLRKLSSSLQASFFLKAPEDTSILVKGVSLDSRTVQPGDLFIACSGAQHQGSEFITEALDRGALAVLFDENVTNKIVDFSGANVPMMKVPRLQNKLMDVAQLVYGNPSLKLPVIGVTGTNGKTSCCYFIAQLFSILNLTCPIIGTLGYGFYPQLEKTNNTTLDILSNYKLLNNFLLKKVEAVALEVSSHALIQERITGINFHSTVFTNLSAEHLDYHKSMTAYLAAKKLLFTQYKSKYAVINLNDSYSAQILGVIPSSVISVSYSEKIADNQAADFYCRKVTGIAQGLLVFIVTPLGESQHVLQLYSFFSIGNLLAALAVMFSSGYDLKYLLNRLAEVQSPPGRMQAVQLASSPLVLIDYAHTPDALQGALISARKHCKGRLWVLFGCGGDRWEAKRPLMGKIACKLADQVILTSDNPRTQSPKKIIEEIEQGCISYKTSVQENRDEAIKEVIKKAAKDDVVLLAGKGHEQEQVYRDATYHFSDYEVANNYLRKYYL